MAVKDTAKDPLNWLLLVLALAFGYYVIAVPYWTDYYLKEAPQEMALEEYLRNPSHPRPFVFHALGTPPSSIEIVVSGLRVAHIDPDAIVLETTEPLSMPADEAGTAAGAEEPGTEERAGQPGPEEGMAQPEAGEGEAPAGEAEGGAVPTDAEGEAGAAEDSEAPERQEAATEEEAGDGEPGPAPMAEESPPPNDEILIPGENMDLLELSVGQQVSLQVHDLHETQLGWVPQNPGLDRGTEEMFTKEELDELEFIKIHSDGNTITIPYIETGELRFASGVHPPGEAYTLEQLSDDTDYIRTAQRLIENRGLVDLVGVRIVGKAVEDRNPYFILEDGEGRRARVYYNPRLLKEWYWVRPRLDGQPVVVRGQLRPQTPSDLRQLESEANVQAVLSGYAILSEDGTKVFNLENPAEEGLGASP